MNFLLEHLAEEFGLPDATIENLLYSAGIHPAEFESDGQPRYGSAAVLFLADREARLDESNIFETSAGGNENQKFTNAELNRASTARPKSGQPPDVTQCRMIPRGTYETSTPES